MIIVESIIRDAGIPLAGEGDTVVMGWQERRTTRQRVKTQKGRELAIALPTGTVLLHGDLLWSGQDFYVTVEAEKEDALIVPLGDATSAAALAYELGNRHLPVSIRDNVIMTPYDRLVESVVAHSGLPHERRKERFEPAARGDHHG